MKLGNIQFGDYFYDIMHQRQFKHPIEVDFMILKNVLKRPLRTVFSQHTGDTIDNGAIESHEMIVLYVLHCFEFHHQRTSEINWNKNLFHSHGVAFVTADGDENLTIVYQVFRIHRLRTRRGIAEDS